mmetsp:Transcript_13219/g.19734  ORF Transcript_13219/g.19734 Transcript_13219/m.19734 type:complete len:482 (-) Transcript_13219:31-1476(-)
MFAGFAFAKCIFLLEVAFLHAFLPISLKPSPSFDQISLSKTAPVPSSEKNVQSAIAKEDNELPLASEIVSESVESLRTVFEVIDSQTKFNMKRVLESFRKHKVGSEMFGGMDGYGNGDIGRDTIDLIYADIFGSEKALVRSQCFSGTHAIACCLFGVLRPSEKMLACSGKPYDTLEEVIGLRGSRDEQQMIGSLKDFNIGYSEVPLTSESTFDLNAIDEAISSDATIKLLHVQRSCGYQWRKSIPIHEIEKFCTHIRTKWASRPELVIFVDNCYGEFVEEKEPTMVGADIVAGSLIKNPGGTIVRSGGYIAGRSKYVDAAANRLSAPGVVGGASFGQNRFLYQGLFMAGSIVGESLKGAHLLSHVMGAYFDFPTNPLPFEKRTDIIQSIALGSREKVLKFCQVVQRLSPINAHYRPEPGLTSGYGDEVIFADGCFTDGSTLELSMDGPLREPYAVYAQGCVHWSHWAIILEEALVEMKLAR